MDILHCDLNNFYASVECSENPKLYGKFVAVSGNPEHRHGIILAKNTLAKQMGVKTGEAIWQAKQKCPDLICVPPHFDLYVHYSHRVREIYSRYTDLIQSFGLDECWLDVTNSKDFGTPTEIADRLRKEVREETGLTISVGVSFNKVFAKLGSDLKKPDATTVITRDNYKDIVWPLEAQEMLFIGSKTQQKLRSMGIVTIGDLANASPLVLKRVFGINGEKIRRCASGLDEEKVDSNSHVQTVKSVGHGTTTLRDMKTYTDAEKVITYLSEMVATRLRRYGMQCNTVHLSLRFNDLSHIGKQCKVHTTCVAQEISSASVGMLHSLWNPANQLPLRSLSVTAGNLVEVGNCLQMSLFQIQDEKKQRLEFSLDQIRKKYGFTAITRANFIGNDLISDKFCGEEDLLPFKR